MNTFQDASCPGGTVIAHGGGWIAPEIRRWFVERAGGSAARIILIPAIDLTPEKVEQLLSPWRELGVAVELFNIIDRQQADSAEFCESLRQATGVWLGGGYQCVLARRYIDTLVQRMLHEVLERQGVIGGCSAGTAFLSKVMILEGEIEPQWTNGLGLLGNVIFDQHFLTRNRFSRLMWMLERWPEYLGIGIDENTALVIEPNTWTMRVIGDSYVFVCLPECENKWPRIEIVKANEVVTLDELKCCHRSFKEWD